MTQEGKVIVFLGPIGSGKTIQAQQLSAELNAKHIYPGQLVRENLSDNPKLKSGELLPDQTINELIEVELNNTSVEQNIVFDGFPRKMSQKLWLEGLLKISGRRVDTVVVLEVDQQELDRRIELRSREDDTDESISNRVKVFKVETKPVIEAFDEQGIVKKINGNLSIGEVTDLVLAAVKE